MTSNRRRVFFGIVIILLVFFGVLLVTSFVNNFDNFTAWLAAASDPSQVIECSDSAGCSTWHPILFGLVVVVIMLTGFAYTTLLERRFIAFFQQRVGPNRAGPKGVFQPVADAIKLIFKEDIIPAQADKAVYYMAPVLKAVPVIILVAVIPLGPPMVIPWFDGNWYRIPLAMADINVGVLWLLAVTSLGTYGMVLAGWASNNKYAMIGGLRASAQMISYELSLGLAIAVPVMIVGSMSLGAIIDAQANVWDWFVFQNPLAAGLVIITLFAEVSRSPFDLTEAEQELTAGYMTEYSGMKFALFMMAEYIGMIAVSMIIVALFFGGYHLVPMDSTPLIGVLVYIGKVVAFLFFFIWVRSTLPRLRYDRLMALGWKVLLPLSLLAVAWTAISIVVGDASGSPIVYGIISGIFFVVIVVGGYFFLRAETGREFTRPEPDLAEDPMVTGERGGPGWIGLNLLGGLLASVFGLVAFTLNSIEGLGRLGEETVTSDETAIEPADGGD